jgi:hypothetical protein
MRFAVFGQVRSEYVYQYPPVAVAACVMSSRMSTVPVPPSPPLLAPLLLVPPELLPPFVPLLLPLAVPPPSFDDADEALKHAGVKNAGRAARPSAEAESPKRMTV